MQVYEEEVCLSIEIHCIFFSLS